jgi:lipid-binding SYLF domain-containing protein
MNDFCCMNRLVCVVLIALLSGCASLGDTPDAKRATVLEMRDQTLARLFEAEPGARQRIAEAAGYGVFDAASQNLILLQTGGGYGVLTSADGATTFMKVGGAGVGFGIGLKDYREVIIFRTRDSFERFRDSGWEASGQAEATAQAGASGGAAAGKQSLDLDVRTYQIMEAGIALQATVGASKYWKWTELNR